MAELWASTKVGAEESERRRDAVYLSNRIRRLARARRLLKVDQAGIGIAVGQSVSK